jgi:hypothetical protein
MIGVEVELTECNLLGMRSGHSWVENWEVTSADTAKKECQARVDQFNNTRKAIGARPRKILNVYLPERIEAEEYDDTRYAPDDLPRTVSSFYSQQESLGIQAPTPMPIAEYVPEPILHSHQHHDMTNASEETRRAFSHENRYEYETPSHNHHNHDAVTYAHNDTPFRELNTPSPSYDSPSDNSSNNDSTPDSSSNDSGTSGGND